MKFPNAIAHNRVELVAVATAMLRGEKDLLEGVREICSLRHAIGEPENKTFALIRAVDSETDHFPLGDVRDQWAPERLRQIDIERERYFDEARNDVLTACNEIIRAFS